MARGQLPKAYLRLDPNIDAHADPEAMVLLTVWANRQPSRGRFKRLDALQRVLGPVRLEAAKERKDLVQLPDGSWYLDGWDEWQEGDVEVGERMRRLRAKRSGVEATPAKVYFAQAGGDGGPVKIGHSVNPWARVADIRGELASERGRKLREALGVAPGPAVALVGTVDGSFADEAAWHRRFEGANIVGEWFRATPELLRAVAVATTEANYVVTTEAESPSPPSEASRRLGVQASTTEAAAASLSPGSVLQEGGVGGGEEPLSRAAGLAAMERSSLELARLELGRIAARVASHPFGGGDVEQLLLEASRTDNGAAFSDPDACTSTSWLKVTRDKLRSLERENQDRAASAGLRWAPQAQPDRGPPSSADVCTAPGVGVGMVGRA